MLGTGFLSCPSEKMLNRDKYMDYERLQALVNSGDKSYLIPYFLECKRRNKGYSEFLNLVGSDFPNNLKFLMESGYRPRWAFKHKTQGSSYAYSDDPLNTYDPCLIRLPVNTYNRFFVLNTGGEEQFIPLIWNRQLGISFVFSLLEKAVDYWNRTIQSSHFAVNDPKASEEHHYFPIDLMDTLYKAIKNSYNTTQARGGLIKDLKEIEKARLVLKDPKNQLNLESRNKLNVVMSCVRTFLYPFDFLRLLSQTCIYLRKIFPKKQELEDQRHLAMLYLFGLKH